MEFGIFFVYLFLLLLFCIPSFCRYMHIRFRYNEEESSNSINSSSSLPRTRSVSLDSSDLEQ